MYSIGSKNFNINPRGGYSVYAVSTVLSNEIWFVLGMSICIFDIRLKRNRLLGLMFGTVFLALSIVIYVMNIDMPAISFILGVMACIAVIFLVASCEEKTGKAMKSISKYTMPIFLMHTLFTASLRIILMKVGITNATVHVILGVAISFLGPMVAAWIMKKTKWMEFFLYPNKLFGKVV